MEGIAGLKWCVESKAKRGSFLDHVLYLHIMFKDFGEGFFYLKIYYSFLKYNYTTKTNSI
jgi:hypothetical protein